MKRLQLTLAVTLAMALPSSAQERAAATDPARVGAPPPRFAAPDRQARLATAYSAIDRIFHEFGRAEGAPGVAWGVVVDGQLAHAGASGFRDLEARAPAAPDSLFRIASMTKSVTALAVLKLRDQGRLALDDPAERYVPELAELEYPTRDSPRITIRHLLTHSAGFPEDNPWGDRHLDAGVEELAAWTREGIPFSRAPGVDFEYSNYGFALLGQVVAAAAGEPYREYVDEAILRTLGMTASTWEAGSVPPGRLARGYRRAGDEWTEELPLAHGSFGAMGGLYSSIEDLARYTAFLLSAWPPRDDPETGPVRRATAREMQRAWRATRATATRSSVDAPLRLLAGGYGYGLGSRSECGFDHVVAHGGGLPGYGSDMTWLPDHGVAVLCLANVTYAGCGGAVRRAVAALAASGGLQPRVAQPDAALLEARDGVSRLITSWDDALADSLAADNLFLDRPRDVRRAELEMLIARHGACRNERPLDVENALRGSWRMECERGHLQLRITLAPTSPPRVQLLEARGALPLEGGMAAAAARLAALSSAPAGTPLALPLAPGFDEAALRARLEAASAWGACRVDEVLEGDGAAQARVRFACASGDLEARLELDGEGRVTAASLRPDPRATCAP